MKRRRVERVERRKARAELNMLRNTKSRSIGANRGCASLVGRLLAGLLLILGATVGLS